MPKYHRHHKTSQDITRHHKTSQDITAGCGNDRAQLHQLLLVDTNLSKLRDQQKLGFEIETYWKCIIQCGHASLRWILPNSVPGTAGFSRVSEDSKHIHISRSTLIFITTCKKQSSHPNLWQCTGCSFFFCVAEPKAFGDPNVNLFAGDCFIASLQYQQSVIKTGRGVWSTALDYFWRRIWGWSSLTIWTLNMPWSKHG